MIGFDVTKEVTVNIERGRKAVLFTFETFKDVVEQDPGTERGLGVRMLFKLPIRPKSLKTPEYILKSCKIP